MKICTIVGARPQFIKAAAVSRVIVESSQINEVLIHTGQHYDANMSDQFFTELSIPQPKYNLNIGSASHGKQTGLMLAQIEEVLISEKPDATLIYGDTNSTLAGALASAKLDIPVAHVEAGLRSFNRKMPEEINRITADHLSQLLFAPTDVAYQQLLKEGIEESQIFQVGDVMYDATLFYNELNSNRRTLVNQFQLKPQSFILVTIHRAENTDNLVRLKNIVDALVDLSHQFQVVLPLHPRTRAQLIQSDLLAQLAQSVNLIEPVGYLDMLALEQHAFCIVTDSGGVQKEAYFNQVPCITLRNETEWVELVHSGWNRLCSPDASFSLTDNISQINITDRTKNLSLYGKGDAAKKIVQTLIHM